ncbi:hypothetical protein HMPREF1978_01680 [Actinomyces graevenitzii F0530]|uniref:Uncharacterized protein n=1 Tax=Actinomyces graevenitzii F0530 TaxID=1321817 RepID=U1R7S8_9ACTO|nr:hypothetical protein HMPREF1978_01680 [Actinomyces graevenitzii F0530]
MRTGALGVSGLGVIFCADLNICGLIPSAIAPQQVLAAGAR